MRDRAMDVSTLNDSKTALVFDNNASSAAGEINIKPSTKKVLKKETD